MGKDTKKKQQNELEKQAQVNELLAKINAQRAAGEISSEPKEKNENIRAAKEKLTEAYNSMLEMERDRQERAKRNDPNTHTYTDEEKARIVQEAKDATARYMKLKKFVEDFEELKQVRENEETLRKIREEVDAERAARAEAAKAAAAKKSDEE